jgi:WhiB family redox-sensing transcriptional regulator
MTSAASIHAHVAEIANAAHKAGHASTEAVADRFGVNLRYASNMMRRAREAGWDIPHSLQPWMLGYVRDIAPIDDRRQLLESLERGAGDFNKDNWRERANCRGIDPNLFHPERGSNGHDMATAKQVCAGCSVRKECLEYALDNMEKVGVWGGLSERERRRVRRDNVTERRWLIVEIA